MNNFNWLKAISFGIMIWAIMFALTWATIGLGIFGSVWTQVALAVIAGIASYTFAMNTKASDMGPALGYGAMFAVIGIVLDLIISRVFVAGLFSLWTYYLAYAAILFAPSIELGFRGNPSSVTR